MIIFARETVLTHHKKEISDQVSACTQREDKEWKYRMKSVLAGWFVNFQSSVK